MSKSYSELKDLQTYDERLKYLYLNGSVGIETFGDERYLNQLLYRSPEWKRVRDQVIMRDRGFDLGVEDVLIDGPIYVHHINPITPDDILERRQNVFDLNNLISMSRSSHDAIHYGRKSNVMNNDLVERKSDDTKLW
jgi:hypothetical protein